MENKTNNTFFVSTVEDLRQAVATNHDCIICVTQELNDKLNRNLGCTLSNPPEDFDLFFELYSLMDIMAQKRIRYEVKKDDSDS